MLNNPEIGFKRAAFMFILGLLAFISIAGGVWNIFLAYHNVGTTWTPQDFLIAQVATALIHINAAVMLSIMAWVTRHLDEYDHHALKFIGYVISSAFIFLFFLGSIISAWPFFTSGGQHVGALFVNAVMSIILFLIIGTGFYLKHKSDKADEYYRRKEKLRKANETVNLGNLTESEQMHLLAYLRHIRLEDSEGRLEDIVEYFDDEGELTDEFFDVEKPKNEEKQKLSDLIKPKR